LLREVARPAIASRASQLDASPCVLQSHGRPSGSSDTGRNTPLDHRAGHRCSMVPDHQPHKPTPTFRLSLRYRNGTTQDIGATHGGNIANAQSLILTLIIIAPPGCSLDRGAAAGQRHNGSRLVLSTAMFGHSRPVSIFRLLPRCTAPSKVSEFYRQSS
jgi:hypothetical protein